MVTLPSSPTTIGAVKGKKEITHDDGPRRLLGRRFCRSQGGDGRGKRLGRGGGKHSSLVDVCACCRVEGLLQKKTIRD